MKSHRSEEQKKRAPHDRFFAIGGHGLRSAVRMSSGAFWASWGDATHMVADKLPHCRTPDLEFSGHRRPKRLFGRMQEAARALGPPRFRQQTNLGTIEVRHDLHKLMPNVASGNMAGNITRIPLPNTTFGKP